MANLYSAYNTDIHNIKKKINNDHGITKTLYYQKLEPYGSTKCLIGLKLALFQFLKISCGFKGSVFKLLMQV